MSVSQCNHSHSHAYSSDWDAFVRTVTDYTKFIAARLDLWHDFEWDFEKVAHLWGKREKLIKKTDETDREIEILRLTFSLHRRFSMSYRNVLDAFVTSVKWFPVKLYKIHVSTVPEKKSKQMSNFFSKIERQQKHECNINKQSA